MGSNPSRWLIALALCLGAGALPDVQIAAAEFGLRRP
jgi:hypothetical protein